MAREAVHIERGILREPGGIQDQYCAAYGGLNLIEVARNGDVTVHSLNIDLDGLESLNEHLMLFFTGSERLSGEIHTKQSAEVVDHLDDYRQMRSLALDTAKALERLDFTEVGHLMDDNWRLKRRLSNGITSEEIDGAYDAAKSEGALGGKLLGAGGGGFLLFLVPVNRQREVRRALEARGLVSKSARFEISGSTIVHQE